MGKNALATYPTRHTPPVYFDPTPSIRHLRVYVFRKILKEVAITSSLFFSRENEESLAYFKNLDLDKNFRTKLFVGQNFRHLEEVLSDKVLLMFGSEKFMIH